MKSIYPNLEAELKRKKITHSKLAAMLNIPDSAMSLRFAGKTKFKIDEIRIIINTLDLDFNYLFEEGK